MRTGSLLRLLKAYSARLYVVLREGAFLPLSTPGTSVMLPVFLVVTFGEEGDMDIYWVEVNIATEQLTVHRTASLNKESFVPKSQ